MDDTKKRYILEFLENDNIINLNNEKPSILAQNSSTPNSFVKKSLNINVNAFFPNSMKKKLNDLNTLENSSPAKNNLFDLKINTSNIYSNIFNPKVSIPFYNQQDYIQQSNNLIFNIGNKVNSPTKTYFKIKNHLNNSGEKSIYDIESTTYINNK